MFMSEGGKISQKIKVWFSDYFNISDFIAIIMFVVGFGLRFGDDNLFIAGRIVYCLNIIFWYVRLLDILAVNQQAGPYVMMIGKMVSNFTIIVSNNFLRPLHFSPSACKPPASLLATSVQLLVNTNISHSAHQPITRQLAFTMSRCI